MCIRQNQQSTSYFIRDTLHLQIARSDVTHNHKEKLLGLEIHSVKLLVNYLHNTLVNLHAICMAKLYQIKYYYSNMEEIIISYPNLSEKTTLTNNSL